MIRFFLLALALVSGCADDSANTRVGPMESVTTAGPCTTGSQTCHCPDGMPSGSQFCDAQQRLSECVCQAGIAGLAGGAAPGPLAGEVSRVCAQLQGQASCDASSYQSAEVPASILFVVDRSGSMACNAPPIQSVEDCNEQPRRIDDSAPSRWETTVAALGEAFTGLGSTTAAVGLSFFSTDGVCGADSTARVGVAPVDATQMGLLADALGNTVPSGGTPIVGATILAYHHLHEELHAGGNRYVVLMTDGEESCGNDGDAEALADLQAARQRLLEQEVLNAREANIRTFVIGAPGSEGARGFLSELAYLGGTARSADCVHGDPEADAGNCHYDLTAGDDFGAVLASALGEISGEAVGCEYETPGGGSRDVNVQASLGGDEPTCLSYDPAPCKGGANGWQFARDADGSDDLSRVVLCGEACEMVKQNPSTVIDVILGCTVLE